MIFAIYYLIGQTLPDKNRPSIIFFHFLNFIIDNSKSINYILNSPYKIFLVLIYKHLCHVIIYICPYQEDKSGHR